MPGFESRPKDYTKPVNNTSSLKSRSYVMGPMEVLLWEAETRDYLENRNRKIGVELLDDGSYVFIADRSPIRGI